MPRSHCAKQNGNKKLDVKKNHKQPEEQCKMTTYSTHELKGIWSKELIKEGFGRFKKNVTEHK